MNESNKDEIPEVLTQPAAKPDTDNVHLPEAPDHGDIKIIVEDGNASKEELQAIDLRADRTERRISSSKMESRPAVE